jgi:menaquinone-dependent protoporphyrinogen oxidase
MNVLILYGTTEGQTKKVSHCIAEAVRKKGHQAETQCVDQLPDNFPMQNYDAAIIGGSIHMGNYQKYLKEFVVSHLDWLNSVPSGFFTVCMGIQSQNEKDREAASRYGETFLRDTGWHPRQTKTFAGAVKYTQYNFITRFIMKMISRREGGSIDTSCDHEYTDWNAVSRFADQFILDVGG